MAQALRAPTPISIHRPACSLQPSPEPARRAVSPAHVPLTAGSTPQAQPIQDWLRTACLRAAEGDSLDLPDGLTAADWACVRAQASVPRAWATAAGAATLARGAGDELSSGPAVPTEVRLAMSCVDAGLLSCCLPCPSGWSAGGSTPAAWKAAPHCLPCGPLCSPRRTGAARLPRRPPLQAAQLVASLTCPALCRPSRPPRKTSMGTCACTTSPTPWRGCLLKRSTAWRAVSGAALRARTRALLARFAAPAGWQRLRPARSQPPPCLRRSANPFRSQRRGRSRRMWRRSRRRCGRWHSRCRWVAPLGVSACCLRCVRIACRASLPGCPGAAGQCPWPNAWQRTGGAAHSSRAVRGLPVLSARSSAVQHRSVCTE